MCSTYYAHLDDFVDRLHVEKRILCLFRPRFLQTCSICPCYSTDGKTKVKGTPIIGALLRPGHRDVMSTTQMLMSYMRNDGIMSIYLYVASQHERDGLCSRHSHNPISAIRYSQRSLTVSTTNAHTQDFVTNNNHHVCEPRIRYSPDGRVPQQGRSR